MVARFVGEELIGNIVMFPVWWYTRGLAGVIQYGLSMMKYRLESYAFSVWIRNLFVPMYGMRDWSARLISFVMRVVVIVARGCALIVEACLYLTLVLAWVALLPGCIVALLLNLSMNLV